MDTLIHEKKEFIVPYRACEYAITFSLFFTLALSNAITQPPPMFANDLIANTSISAPHLQKMTEYLKEEMNPEIKKEKI